MIDITVTRGLGDRPGDPVEDSLLTDVEAAKERGRNLIEYNYSDRQEITINGPFKEFMRPRRFVNVTDSQGNQFNAMVKSCSISFSFQGTFAADCSLVLEKVYNE